MKQCYQSFQWLNTLFLGVELTTGIFEKLKGGIILTTNNNIMMNLKYNRIDMKKAAKGERIIRRGVDKRGQLQKEKVHKKKSTRAKRSPATRDFGTDLTNRPEPFATQTEVIPQEKCPTSPPEISPYLNNIIEHLIHNDQQFNSHVSVAINREEDFGKSKMSTEMRKVLVRWLMQVSRKFQVKDETLHLCIQIIDYVLLFSNSQLTKQNFQLLGVAALFVASKYNEIHTFQAEKYVFLCDGLYTVEQLFQMESLILTTTNFNLQFPTTNQFTNIFLFHYKLDLHLMVGDLINLSMFNCILFSKFRKQHLAAVIVYFAAKMVDSPILKENNLKEQLGVPSQIFDQCFFMLLELYRIRDELK